MGTMSDDDQAALGDAVGTRIGRVLEVVFSVFAVVVFVILWIYVAAAAFSDGQLLADTWAWYEGFGLIGSIVVGIAILPVIVFLWAWQANLDPWAFGLVMVLLIGWSFVAFSSIFRVVRRALRRSRSS